MDRLFETNTLTRVVNDLRTPVHGFLMMLFNMVLQFEEEKVYFDRDRPDQGLMPASLPTVQAVVTQEKSYDTESFQPGYRKHKTPCDINRPFRRAAGEQISGSSTPRERARMAVAENLAMHKMMFYNLLEYFCAQTLVYGGYAMVGQQYPERIIDFNRPDSHSIVLSGSDRWSNAASDPNDDLLDWAELGAKNGAGMLDTLIMGNAAFKAFRSHAKVKEKFDWASNSRNMSDVDTGSQFDRGIKYRGQYDGFAIYTYQDWYKSDGYHYHRNAAGVPWCTKSASPRARSSPSSRRVRSSWSTRRTSAAPERSARSAMSISSTA